MAKNPYRSQIQLLKVIGHPARWKILQLLRPGEECVCHLTAALHSRQAYVSQQLIFLRQAGVVEDRKDGARVYYRVRDSRVFEILDLVNGVTGAEQIAAPETLAKCPCPKCQSNGQR